VIPSRRHGSFTVTSRRKPSRTTWIFFSGVYLRRVAALTRRQWIWSALSAPRRPLVCLVLIGSRLLLYRVTPPSVQ